MYMVGCSVSTFVVTIIILRPSQLFRMSGKRNTVLTSHVTVVFYLLSFFSFFFFDGRKSKSNTFMLPHLHSHLAS